MLSTLSRKQSQSNIGTRKRLDLNCKIIRQLKFQMKNRLERSNGMTISKRMIFVRLF